MSGKIFEVGKQPHDHPNGRCVFNPYIPELAEYDPELYKHDPEENFAKLSEKEQLEILGPAKFEMWKNGELKLGDLASVVSNPDYGDSIRIRPLVDLKLDKTPAEEYNIDKRFYETFNSMTPDMQKLFAPYLKEGEVDPDLDDSGVDEEIKKAKGYHSPLSLAVKMQEYTNDNNQGGRFSITEDYALRRGIPLKSVKSNGDDKPLYKLVKKALKKDKIKEERYWILKHWESSSHSKDATLAREAASVLFGGDAYNRDEHKLDPLNVIETMFLLQKIYDDDRKEVNKRAKNGVIHLLRAVDGESGIQNSLISWTSNKSPKEHPGYDNFAEYWADVLEEKAREQKREAAIRILEDDFDPDCVLTIYGIERGLTIADQDEHIILGGLL